MPADAQVASPAAAEVGAFDSTAVYVEGIRTGLVGAAVIALWFLIVDTVQGRPLYTPNVLGTALFHPGHTPGAAAIDFETVLSFTWVHVLVFLVIGVAAARLLALAERYPSSGFGIVLLFVVVQAGFIVGCMFLAEPVLRALTWPAVLAGNVLAAAAMGAVLRHAHPRLTISP